MRYKQNSYEWISAYFQRFLKYSMLIFLVSFDPTTPYEMY